MYGIPNKMVLGSKETVYHWDEWLWLKIDDIDHEIYGWCPKAEEIINILAKGSNPYAYVFFSWDEKVRALWFVELGRNKEKSYKQHVLSRQTRKMRKFW